MSVEEIKEDKLAIVYPNPTNGLLNIQFSDYLSNIKIELYDISGKLIKQQLTNSLESNNIEILNVDNVVNGSYLLRISTNNRQETYRIIVSK
ncbi:MAG: T9SS type A sorting domain-containing protein [Flavobacterium sp.]